MIYTLPFSFNFFFVLHFHILLSCISFFRIILMCITFFSHVFSVGIPSHFLFTSFLLVLHRCLSPFTRCGVIYQRIDSLSMNYGSPESPAAGTGGHRNGKARILTLSICLSLCVSPSFRISHILHYLLSSTYTFINKIYRLYFTLALWTLTLAPYCGAGHCASLTKESRHKTQVTARRRVSFKVSVEGLKSLSIRKATVLPRARRARPYT